MSDILKTSISVQLSETDIQKTTRFLDDSISHVPISYEQGQATLIGGLTNHQLASSVNQIILMVEGTGTITVKVGDTTAPSMTNMKMFVYDGDSTSIFISNPGVDPIKVKFVAGKF